MSQQPKKKYDSTVARIAGNIAAGLVNHPLGTIDPKALAEHAVMCARFIVAEVERTEPDPPSSVPPQEDQG